jgi:hypothetical protein
MMPTDKLAAVLWEADRHSNILTEALAEWNVSPTITWQAFENDRARVRIVDQLTAIPLYQITGHGGGAPHTSNTGQPA